MERKRPADLVPGDWVRMPHVNRIKLVAAVEPARCLHVGPHGAVLVSTSGGALWLCADAAELETYTTEEARAAVLGERTLRAAAGAFGFAAEQVGVPDCDDLPHVEDE